ncbi:MAG: PriCT-2 domain-containing protein, partial [Kiritimatiellaeota bacterium]|nr:PriCT-2 domain-containing protein [Kiritimatiellota bacterium]
MALHHEFRGSPEAFKIWDNWSSRSKTKYVIGETTYHWQSFDRAYTKRPVTGATLLYYSKA